MAESKGWQYEMWNMLDFSVVKLAPKFLSGKYISQNPFPWAMRGTPGISGR